MGISVFTGVLKKMRKTKNKRGTVIFETLLGIQLFVLILFSCHVGIVRLWRGKIEQLQKSRIPYDGDKKWVNIES